MAHLTNGHLFQAAQDQQFGGHQQVLNQQTLTPLTALSVSAAAMEFSPQMMPMIPSTQVQRRQFRV